MQIIIALSLLLRSVTEYGCFVVTSRLPDHVRSLIISAHCIGPFVITTQINDATFRLNLPSHMRLHPVFHSSLLEPCRTSSIPNRVVPPPPFVQLADSPEYEVAAILDSKIMRNKLYYLVDWLGYPPNDRTLEPVTNVGNAQALVNDFHRRYANKLGTTFLTPTSTRRSRRRDNVMTT